jgi:hypothetical protein
MRRYTRNSEPSRPQTAKPDSKTLSILMRRMQSRPNPSDTCQQELTPERVVVRDPPGNLAAAQAAEDVWDEVEGAGPLAVGQALPQGGAVGFGEPGQLVVEVPGLVVIDYMC